MYPKLRMKIKIFNFQNKRLYFFRWCIFSPPWVTMQTLTPVSWVSSNFAYMLSYLCPWCQAVLSHKPSDLCPAWVSGHLKSQLALQPVPWASNNFELQLSPQTCALRASDNKPHRPVPWASDNIYSQHWQWPTPWYTWWCQPHLPSAHQTSKFLLVHLLPVLEMLWIWRHSKIDQIQLHFQNFLSCTCLSFQSCVRLFVSFLSSYFL